MESRQPRLKQPFWGGFVAGLVAGVVASGVMLLLNVVAAGLSLPQEFGSQLTAWMPAPMFAFLHQIIGDNAKYYFFSIVLVGQCLVFALGGALYNRFANAKNEPLSWSQGIFLAVVLWLFAGMILLPLTGSGIFGASLAEGMESGILSLAAVGLVYGLLFVFGQRWLVASQLNIPERTIRERTEEGEELQPLTRRRLFKQGTIAVGVAVVGFGIWHFIIQGIGAAKVPVAKLLQGYTSKITPPPTPNYGTIQPAQFLSPEITSNDQFYIVSKNFTDPTVSSQGWTVKVDGMVDNPFSLTYADLLALPMQQQYESLECISNDVGGSYMSNALWEGVRLSDLLERAGVKPGSTKVVLHAYDDYTDSIHLSKALETTTLVAVRMNGVTLPDGHGYPARLLVPGIYGMKHVKWLTEIEVVNYDYQGYWQQRGWSDPAPVRLTSRIDTPLDGANVTAHSLTYIAGVAFSGNQGISEVDVSVDGAQTWQRATLKRPLSALTWVIWELPWTPKAGSYTVTVRAVDLAGNVQDPHEESTLPDGASGYESISITAS